MIAKVLVEISHSNIDRTFDYKVPFELEKKIKIGQRVLVSFARQTLEGFVIAFTDKSEHDDLKEIIKLVDDEITLSTELLSLAKHVSETTLSTKIAALQAMLPKGVKASAKSKLNKKYISLYSLDLSKDIKTTSPAQEKLLEFMKTKKQFSRKDLTDFSLSALNTLIKKGYITVEKIEEYRLKEEAENIKHLTPTEKQSEIINEIKSATTERPFLLHGVTGSGKTLVYIELIKVILNQGKTALILLPEIAITVQTIALFRAYFGDEIAVYHSRLSDGEKYDEYRRIYRGEVKIVIGARSAVFTPLKNLGIIVIDEEHSNSYKQENNPKYDTLDVAKYRVKEHGAKLILASATPSLESFARAQKGVYHLLSLDKRPFDCSLPEVELVDMTKEKNKSSIFSKKLIDEINNALKENHQIMILLNRRGYSNYILCSSCGEVEKCPDCDISLTYHKTSNMLRCHYCGYARRKPEVCSNCSEDALRSLGSGTQKLEEELNKLFDCKILRMDFDTTSTKGAHQRIIDKFRNKEADILLGTQMIAKGLDFENVSLVGIISADTSLMIPNFRASEETFQLLSQVAGRAGRKGQKSKVIVQSYNPDHYAIRYAKKHDYLGFYKEEMKNRRILSYPPYYYLTSIKVISKDYDLASKSSSLVAHHLRSNLKKETIVLGPSLAAVFKLKGRYHFSIVIKYKFDDSLHKVLKEMKNHYSKKDLKIDIEFNPWFI